MADWNKSYANAETRLFGDTPNEYMREVLARSDVNPQSVLCLADGDGRNGAWLAGLGLDVTAVDISEVATEQAQANDRRMGVTVERIAADLATWTPPKGRTWDAVFMIFLQCEGAVRNHAAAVAARALAPGGWFAAEGFAPSNSAENGDLGPGMPDLLYERDDLIAALGGLQIVEAFKGWTYLKEGKRHQGKGWVLRLLAQKV